jgi:hypothetical protein
MAAMDRAVRQAQELGHLDDKADPAQILFEIHGLILALHYEARFLKTPGSIDRALRGFASILQRYADAEIVTNKPLALIKKAPNAIK